MPCLRWRSNSSIQNEIDFLLVQMLDLSLVIGVGMYILNDSESSMSSILKYIGLFYFKVLKIGWDVYMFIRVWMCVYMWASLFFFSGSVYICSVLKEETRRPKATKKNVNPTFCSITSFQNIVTCHWIWILVLVYISNSIIICYI